MNLYFRSLGFVVLTSVYNVMYCVPNVDDEYVRVVGVLAENHPTKEAEFWQALPADIDGAIMEYAQARVNYLNDNQC